jgi:hypothetical protein
MIQILSLSFSLRSLLIIPALSNCLVCISLTCCSQFCFSFLFVFFLLFPLQQNNIFCVFLYYNYLTTRHATPRMITHTEHFDIQPTKKTTTTTSHHKNHFVPNVHWRKHSDKIDPYLIGYGCVLIIRLNGMPNVDIGDVQN